MRLPVRLSAPLSRKPQLLLAASLVFAGGIGVGAVFAAAAGKLIYNGKVASTDVQTINGTPYVRLSDMAKALDMTLVKRPGGYEIIKQGGANQVGSLAGKIGDTLFDGKWRFQVVKMETPASYTMKSNSETYDAAGLTSMDYKTRVITPSRGKKLVVLLCRVVNGVKEKRTLWTAISDERIHTALTDKDGGSYPPIGYDFDGAPSQSAWLLPGAALNFPVIFSVPEGTQVKDLVFSLKNNQNDEPVTDVRVAL